MSETGEVDQTTELILQAQKRLQWMFQNINTNASLARIAKNSFASVLTDALREVQRKIVNSMRERVYDGLLNVTEEDLTEFLDTPEWGKAILPEIELALTQACYRWRFKERFPTLYNAHVEMLGQMALVDEKVVTDQKRKAHTLLALYDHDYFFNHEPVICRIMRPHKVGDTTHNGRKKGKKPGVPQEDLALFVYNGEKLLDGSAEFALVSTDGETFETIDTTHVRAKLIRKQALVKRAFCEGIYTSKGVRLPLLGLQPFWQREFVSFLQLRRSTFRRDFSESEDRVIEKQEAYENLYLSAQRFIGDRLTPEEYWQEFLSVPAFKEILTSETFALAVTNYTGNPKSAQTIAFKMMTIL